MTHDIRSEYAALKELILSRFTQFEEALEAMRLPEMTSTHPHPLDNKTMLVSNELYDARMQLEASLRQMANIVGNPAERIMAEALAHHTSAALGFVEKNGMADVIASSPQQQMHVDDIALSIDSHPTRVSHVLRLLAHNGVFLEVNEGVFANSRSSRLLLGHSSVRQWVRYLSWFSLGFTGKVIETWSDPIKSKSFAQVDAAGNAAWHYCDEGYQSFYDWLHREHPHYADAMAHAFKGYGNIGIMGTLVDYPWDSIQAGGVVVDVGSGAGHLLLPVLQYNPTLRGVVQDIAEILPTARANFGKNLPGANVKYDVIDFFQEQPRKHAEVYLLRWILHDWSDEHVVKLLSRVANAMGPKSRMIVMWVKRSHYLFYYTSLLSDLVPEAHCINIL